MDTEPSNTLRRRQKGRHLSDQKAKHAAMNQPKTGPAESASPVSHDTSDDQDSSHHIESFLCWINAAVGFTVAVIIAVKYAQYCNYLHEKDLWFSNIQEVEREISFRTESGLYYSYYKQLVQSSSLLKGLHDLQHDNLTEHPGTINVLERMNIYQEVVLAAVYRASSLLQRLYEPVYFYIGSIFGLQAVLLGCVYMLAWQLSGTWLAGVLATVLYVLNKADTTRVSYFVALRENFSTPFLWLQMTLITAFLKHHSSAVREVSLVLGLVLSTFLFAITWQFNQFILLLQAMAFFGMQVLELAPLHKLCCLYLIQAASMTSVWVLQFLNPMIPCGILSSFLPAALIIMLIQGWYPSQRVSAAGRLGKILRIVLYIILVLLLTIIINTAIKTCVEQDADEHIIQFILTKLGLVQPRSLEVQLYLCSGAFSFLTYDVYERLTTTWLLPIYLPTHLCLLVCLVWLVMKSNNRSRSAGGNTCDGMPPHMAYHVIQIVFFGGMAMTTLRMKFLWTPYMCVIAAYGVSFKPLAIFSEDGGVTTKVKFVGNILLLALISALLYMMLPGLLQELEELREFYDPDTVELMEWIKTSTRPAAAFTGSMQLLAGVKLCTARPITNHPHFENKPLRLKTAELYKMYGRTPPDEVHRSMVKHNASYVILEDSICLAAMPDGCGTPDVVQVHYGMKPNNGPYVDSPDLTASPIPLFCDRIRHGQSEYTRFFKLVFANRTFRVYQVLSDHHSP